MVPAWPRRDWPVARQSELRFEGSVSLDYRDPRLFGRLLAGATEEFLQAADAGRAWTRSARRDRRPIFRREALGNLALDQGSADGSEHARRPGKHPGLRGFASRKAAPRAAQRIVDPRRGGDAGEVDRRVAALHARPRKRRGADRIRRTRRRELSSPTATRASRASPARRLSSGSCKADAARFSARIASRENLLVLVLLVRRILRQSVRRKGRRRKRSCARLR